MESAGNQTRAEQRLAQEIRNFIFDSAGPDGFVCVFEDDGQTGYLYLYEPDAEGVIKHFQIYNSAKDLNVKEDDVEVVWSSDQKNAELSYGGYVELLILKEIVKPGQN